ncbi:hypothetical protein [Nostoc sp.]|uniref:hypothetical protein n=1 Tax=Nostoc sp. TaxID=1180 RepID=UPI002FF51F72
MKLLKTLFSVGAMSVMTISSLNILMPSTAKAEDFRKTSFELTNIQGSGKAKTGALTVQISINVSGEASGRGSGLFSYRGEQDGLQMVVRAECVNTFLLGNARTTVSTIAGPIVDGSSSVTGKNKWVFVQIKDQNPDQIRVIDVSRETALQLCNAPSANFPATFTFGNITISH